MGIACPGCGRQYDVTLFQFGRTVRCACGHLVSAQAPHRPAALNAVPGGEPPGSGRVASLARLVRVSGARVLDLGTGRGEDALALAARGAAQVIGVDLREDRLAAAERRRRALGLAGVSFLCRDARRIDEAELGRFDLCLCAGLLYHMRNPFNLLKRIRNACRDLVLETHVAPRTLFGWLRMEPEYRRHLGLRVRTAVLDEVSFRGRLKVYPPGTQLAAASGSVDSRVTFWLTRPALARALDLAGFSTEASYFARAAPGQPPIEVRTGPCTSKVFVHARVRAPEEQVAAGSGTIEGPAMLASPNS